MASLIQRNGVYYITDRLSGKIVRHSLRTDSVQIAKEKLRQYQSAQHRGDDNPLPTRTPIADVVGAYVRHTSRRSLDVAGLIVAVQWRRISCAEPSVGLLAVAGLAMLRWRRRAHVPPS